MAKKKNQTTATEPVQADPVETGEASNYLGQWQRAQADLENLQKRSVTERGEAIEAARKGVILDLLPVVDNFDRALAHVPAEQAESGWLTGITYIHKQLIDFLGEYDVRPVAVKPGDAFDHNWHHAVQTVASEYPADQIVSVITVPYTMKGELLRPGNVTVSSGPEGNPNN